MEKIKLSFIAKFSLVIFIFLIFYYFYAGIRSIPWEGDSLGYHIPIAKLILSGNIINPALETYTFPTDFYRLYQPGAIESLLSLLILTKIPLNIFDVFGVIFFFFVMYKVGRSYGLTNNFSVIFASSMGTLHTIMRWVLSQTIDVWLASFFGLSLILIRKPDKTIRYFLSLGICLGMLFGGKYSGPVYFLILIILFGKSLLKFINFKRIIVFLIPFSLLGLSWYVRNLILTGDPYFPQDIPFFKGIEYHVLDYPAGQMLLKYPKVWLNALISEYTVWSLSLLTAPILFFRFRNKLGKTLTTDIGKLLIISVLCLIVYLFLPSGPTPSLITSVFRYTYPAFVCLILSIYLLAKKFGKEVFLGIIALTNMIILPELSYHPKILIFLIPIALLIWQEDLFPRKLKA